MRCDVAVIGAGPAGLTAAGYVAQRGARVVVVDEYHRPGGRLLGQVYEDRRKPEGQRLWDGAAAAADLATQVRSSGGTILTGRTVWDVDAGPTLRVAPGPEADIAARAVVIATGATERAIPIPGWTLPGVMTIGAAQVLTNVHSVAPGERVLVVGMDLLSLSITGEMIAAGVNVVGVVLPPIGPLSRERAMPSAVVAELARASSLAPNIALRTGARLFGGRLRGIAATLARIDVLRAWGVPLRLRTSVVEIIGTDHVEAVRLVGTGSDGRPRGRDRLVKVDAVCISGGLAPLSDVVRLAGCPVLEVPRLGGVVPVHGPALETSVPGVFVAGNVIGIEAAAVAAAQGRLAAVGALRSLGALAGADADREIADARDAVAQARRRVAFRFLPDVEGGHAYVERVWAGERPAAIPSPAPRDEMRTDPIVCRCEEVALHHVIAAFEDGATAVAGVKKRTRACMGRCQGRVCEDVLRQIAASRGHDDLLRHRPRSPLRPVRTADLR